MRRKVLGLAATALIIASIALLIISIATGDGQIGIFVIFPFLMASGPIAIAGTILLISGIVAWFASVAVPYEIDEREHRGTGSKVSGVVMLGPVPIAFGPDEKTARRMALIGIGIFAIALVATFLFLWLII